MINSAQNPRLKLTRSLLGQAKTRREEQAFVAEGVRLVEEALAANWPFRFVLHTPDLGARGRRLLQGLEEKRVAVDVVDTRLLDSLSETENSQGIFAVLEHKALPYPEKPDFVLILDQVRDPGNLGTLLRSAHAAGVQAVLLPPETADAFNPKVVRSGMGAHFRLPILSLDWEQIRARSSGLTIHLAEMEGAVPCWQADLRSPLALIVGGEAEGASAEGRRLADRLVCIPMPGGNESLNAAVAGSILLFEVVRQRTR
jgi:TrmH family RNA methyltransferase